jgi:hypothetical protein
MNYVAKFVYLDWILSTAPAVIRRQLALHICNAGDLVIPPTGNNRSFNKKNPMYCTWKKKTRSYSLVLFKRALRTWRSNFYPKKYYSLGACWKFITFLCAAYNYIYRLRTAGTTWGFTSISQVGVRNSYTSLFEILCVGLLQSYCTSVPLKKLRAGRPRCRIRVPVEPRIFSCPYRPDRLWRSSSLLSNGYCGRFLRR